MRLAAALVLLLAATPLVTGANTVLNLLVEVLITAVAAQGWNLLAGYGGQLSFGHAAFFGTGAYVAAVLQARWGVGAWPAAAAGVAAGALLGAAVGAASFRAGLRGSYFALVTLAFAEVLRIAANAADLTGGAAGLLLPLHPALARFQFASRATFLYVALAVVVAGLGITYATARTRFGARLAAVRENEDAARALGIDPFGVKLRAMVLSAGLTAAAGVLYLQYNLFIDADLVFGPAISVAALLAAVVGGTGTVAGPLLGALGLHLLGQALRGALPLAGLDQVLYGALLVAAIALAPRGMMGLAPARRR